MTVQEVAPGSSDMPRTVQQLWRRVLRQGWRSLALVPVDRAAACGGLTRGLVDLGGLFAERFQLLEAADAGPADAPRFAAQLGSWVGGGGRAVVALGPVVDSLAAVTLAAASDAAVLVVRLGSSRLADVRETVEIVGRDRILGCVALRGGRP
jgi:hypothetical protein